MKLDKIQLTALLLAALSGCQYSDVHNGRSFDNEPIMTLCEYVDGLRAAAVEKVGKEDFFYPLGADLMPSMTTHSVKREFQVVYTDERHVSFRADMYDYHGGNGNHNRVIVGTISRENGKVLGVEDFIPKAQWPQLCQRLYEGAVRQLGGKEHLQGEVDIIENFYYDKDGLHFIYNPYEISCGAAGDVEIVIDPKTL